MGRAFTMTRSPVSVVLVLAACAFLGAQEMPERAARENTKGSWFGAPLPAGPGAEPAVLVGNRAPRPFTMPGGEPAAPELGGAALRADLETIVGFSKASR